MKLKNIKKLIIIGGMFTFVAILTSCAGPGHHGGGYYGGGHHHYFQNDQVENSKTMPIYK